MPMPRLTPALVRQYARGAKIAATGYLRPIVGQEGSLPSFLVIGAQRAGTTSLFNYLAAHPQVQPPHSKELQYFSLHYNRGLRWYRGNFPTLAAGEQTFEATPLYLFDERSPARIAADLPDIPLIAMLRDPVKRAYSQYLHNREHGLESLSFADALAAEPERIGRQADGRVTGSPRMLRVYGYLARGSYAEQLRRWYDHVDRSRLLVLRSEDLYRSPRETYARILDFVGLDPFSEVTFGRHNHWRDTSSQLTPELIDSLGEQMRPANEELAALLGWESTWGEAAGSTR